MIIFSIRVGLLLFSLIISDIIERFTEADTVIMGDVSEPFPHYFGAPLTESQSLWIICTGDVRCMLR